MIKILCYTAGAFFMFAMVLFYMHSMCYFIRKKKNKDRCGKNILDGYKYKYHNVVGYEEDE